MPGCCAVASPCLDSTTGQEAGNPHPTHIAHSTHIHKYKGRDAPDKAGTLMRVNGCVCVCLTVLLVRPWYLLGRRWLTLKATPNTTNVHSTPANTHTPTHHTKQDPPISESFSSHHR